MEAPIVVRYHILTQMRYNILRDKGLRAKRAKMPNPRDYMDDEHSYVKGYVRRKHKKETETPELPYFEDGPSKLIIVSWIIHIVAIIIAGIFTFSSALGFGDWAFLSFIALCALLFLLIGRVKYWWDEHW